MEINIRKKKRHEHFDGTFFTDEDLHHHPNVFCLRLSSSYESFFSAEILSINRSLGWSRGDHRAGPMEFYKTGVEELSSILN